MPDPVDDLIRDHMRDSFPRRHGASLVLDELRPKMVRARTHRRAAQASAGMATLSAVLIGVLLVIPQFGTASSNLDVAGPEGSGTVVEPEHPKTLESPTTDVLGRIIEEPLEQATDVVPTSRVVVPEPTTTAAPTTTDTTTTTTQTTTAAPTTTDTSTTTTQTSGLITTPCGSLVAEIVGSGIGLVSTDPGPGFDADVKSSGPVQIEVGFEGEGLPHCEVIVENRDGQIWSDVDEENE